MREAGKISRRAKLAIAGGMLLAALGILVAAGRTSVNNYYVTPAELKAKGEAAYTGDSRVAGQVVNNTIDWDGSAQQFKFKIAYPGGKRALNVVYRGFAPDTFQNESKVLVEGRLDRSGTFIARNILVRCPENYLPERAVGGLSWLLRIEGLLYR